jgi:hypothetical protein
MLKGWTIWSARQSKLVRMVLQEKKQEEKNAAAP